MRREGWEGEFRCEGRGRSRDDIRTTTVVPLSVGVASGRPTMLPLSTPKQHIVAFTHHRISPITGPSYSPFPPPLPLPPPQVRAHASVRGGSAHAAGRPLQLPTYPPPLSQV